MVLILVMLGFVSGFMGAWLIKRLRSRQRDLAPPDAFERHVMRSLSDEIAHSPLIRFYGRGRLSVEGGQEEIEKYYPGMSEPIQFVLRHVVDDLKSQGYVVMGVCAGKTFLQRTGPVLHQN